VGLVPGWTLEARDDMERVAARLAAIRPGDARGVAELAVAAALIPVSTAWWGRWARSPYC
jgi:hypothetical protein